MGEGVTRSFRPEDLERLAGLMDDLNRSADEVFKRAWPLQASQIVAPLRELPAWGSDTAKDLRQRAAIGRLQTGDPFAGLVWAGFPPLEIVANGNKIDPATLISVNSVADWANKTGNKDFHRKPGESLDDYLTRLKAAAISHAIPALEPHEATVANILKIVSDVKGVTATAPIVTTQAVSLSRVLFNNQILKPALTKLIDTAVQGKANALAKKLIPRTRSVAAPGTGLAGLTRQLFMKSKLYRDYVSLLPHQLEMDGAAKAVTTGRALAGARVNNFLNRVFGDNRLAELLGGKTHAGVDVRAAGEANLLKVWSATADPKKMEAAAAILKVEPTALTRLGVVARTAGAFRSLGIVGAVANTGYSAANVISQGNPIDAFKRNGAGYVADIAEVTFNASLTAAMICPSPVALGATVITGAVYVGAKVIEHWDDIEAGAKKVGEAIGEGARKVFSSLNPFD
ncbi:PE-PGRS family protein [Microbispora sp. SCL1-1]|uniref:PE-PGRS family protein n=1 Tax=unclassified Microbispora TaxID=2614687 RepID=UPI001157626F|nr:MULTISPECIES: PE-PGRS family protein [unclassified Microbispora]NJP24253.1 PE-PGRS family protein [Microbispora sp. CL1-1]TQS15051.1 PE-PGRS family protein [Microbispora sp. SCL1-1]